MDRLVPMFETQAGLRLSMTYATPGRTRELLADGFEFHAGVVVASVLSKAKAEGSTALGVHFKLAVSPLGMGVPETGPALPVGTLEEVAATIRALESIGLSDPKAGTNVANEVIAAAERCGFGDVLRAKALFINGPGSVVSAQVAKGFAQAVITLSSEIVPVEGVRFLGRLPAELQTEYALEALLPQAPQPTAQALMEFLRSPAARDVMQAVGLEPVV
jgi:molybdate transport system substrate-binding protein